MKRILEIYAYLSSRRRFVGISLAVSVAILICLVLNLRYSEDISDFLPLDATGQEAFSVYQNISGAERLYILFRNPDDADLTVEAMSCFEASVHRRDSLGWCSDLTVRFDMEQISEVSDFVYDNIPYFLTEEDISRIDSLLTLPGYIDTRLEQDRYMLMFPAGSMAVSGMMRDPLGLFTPVMERLGAGFPQMSMEMYGGHIFTPDMGRAVAMMSSPFGNSETEYNSRLIGLLQDAISDMSGQYPQVEAHIIGGPAIAVENADRIKKDSVLAISLSVVLIILLVLYTIGSVRNILLIFLSIGWGWLFALAGMSLLGGNVSIIVIGISSVVLGIAVNYPLHLIVHRSLVTDMRSALKEVVSPLVIGNITTVGAFLTLVPLRSAALRDLGLFAALMLVGTIAFVLLFLPHLVKGKPVPENRHRFLDRIAGFSPDRSRVAIVCVVAVTAVLSIFSGRTEFDTNLANINYMDDAQREDMQYFQNLLSKSSSSSSRSVYVLSPGTDYDDALSVNSSIVPVIDSLTAAGCVLGCSGVSQFLSSREEQGRRLGNWRDFVSRHYDLLTSGLAESAERHGFSRSAFSEFDALIDRTEKFVPQDIGYFAPLTSSVFSRNLTRVESLGRVYVVDILDVDKDNVKEVLSHFRNAFDVAGMNSGFTRTLSDNFNYIGWACSLIVFFFLWFSFGRIELAAISFLPMAISWVWILGIMAIAGIKFNIVNVILATFIFGQGDDYTIFMTEGCQHEYAYRRPILGSYKVSIMQSALIMFVGIGTLIVSGHPALHSLAEVTIIGMTSVVLMSYMIPPLLFRWLTMKGGHPRGYPLTLSVLFRGRPTDPVSMVRGRYIYKGKDILHHVTRSLRSFAPEMSSLDVEGREHYAFTDTGYGERALLIALTHPDLKVTACIPDEDRRRVAEISAEDFIDNIEFTDRL